MVRPDQTPSSNARRAAPIAAATWPDEQPAIVATTDSSDGFSTMNCAPSPLTKAPSIKPAWSSGPLPDCVRYRELFFAFAE